MWLISVTPWLGVRGETHSPSAASGLWQRPLGIHGWRVGTFPAGRRRWQCLSTRKARQGALGLQEGGVVCPRRELAGRWQRPWGMGSMGDGLILGWAIAVPYVEMRAMREGVEDRARRGSRDD